jgi:AbrB family looped-hinge helix DNA binding protein
MSNLLSKIDANGRLSIPAPYRRALGVEAGGPVVVSLVGNEVRVRAVADAMAELQAEAARFLRGEDMSVDAFLEGRRAEARHEAEAHRTRDGE